MKRLIIIPTAIFLILCLCSCNNTKYYLDGYEITKEEIEYFKTSLKTEVINYFSERYTITDYGTFWTDSFDEITPSEYLEKLAFSEAEKAKAELIIMQQYEIYDDISYSSFKNMAEQYNEEHSGQTGTVGLLSIDMSSFYSYYISDGRLECINIIAAEEAFTSEKISDYRTRNKLPEEMSDELVKEKIAEEKYNEMVAEILN